MDPEDFRRIVEELNSLAKMEKKLKEAFAVVQAYNLAFAMIKERINPEYTECKSEFLLARTEW